MSQYLLYFSPTGGTKRAAEAVAEGLGGAFTPVDLLGRPPQLRFSEEDLCVVAVPSYGGRVPAPAAEQLAQIQGRGARAVLVAVFGNRAIDDTLLELEDLLHQASFRCEAALEAAAQHSLMPQYGAGRPDQADVEELHRFGQQIRAALNRNGPLPDLNLPGSRPYKKYSGVPLKPAAYDHCIGCGLCAAQCPTGAIPLNNFRMTDSRKCISCMHCVAICPPHARKVNRLLTFAASLSMKKVCSGRKPNRLYL